ncbi:MAG: hypothetical protein R3B38_00150 [Patescibacteria group bacterium]
MPEIFFNVQPKIGEYIRVLGRTNKRELKWIKRKYIADHPNLEKWKVFLPKSRGAGAIGENGATSVIADPSLGEPFVAHTQTFMSFWSVHK